MKFLCLKHPSNGKEEHVLCLVYILRIITYILGDDQLGFSLLKKKKKLGFSLFINGSSVTLIRISMRSINEPNTIITNNYKLGHLQNTILLLKDPKPC